MKEWKEEVGKKKENCSLNTGDDYITLSKIILDMLRHRISMSTSNKNTEERQPFVPNWTFCFLHSCQKWRVVLCIPNWFRYIMHLICCSQCSFFYLLINHTFQYRLIGIYIRSFNVVIPFSTKAKGSLHLAARPDSKVTLPTAVSLIKWLNSERVVNIRGEMLKAISVFQVT